LFSTSKPFKTCELLRDFSELDPILFLIRPWSFVRSDGEKLKGHIYYPSSNRFSGKLLNVCGAVQMAANARPFKYLLGWLIAGTRGGVSRAKIIETLNETPQNANQLANKLGMDYRTIRHHLEVLEKNRLVTSAGEGYGTTYFLSPALEENYALFEEILKKIWKK
jgi:DNA-binding transcriptional ArsR family regulator